MNATVIIPYRSEDPERERIFRWCLARWAALTDYPIITPHDDRTEGPFNRSRAVNRGVAMAETDLVVVADADIAVDRVQAEAMVHYLADPEIEANWVIGYHDFQQWTPRATAFVLDGPPDADLPPIDRPRWSSRESVCGLLALRRDDYEAIGGFNESAQGWGGEDVAFAITADTLLGKHQRVPLPCVHLYHPQRPDRKTDADARANLAMMARYEKAEGDAEAITALVREHLALR